MSQLVPVADDRVGPILDATYDLWHDGLSRDAYARLWRAQRATPYGRQYLTRWALTDGDTVLSSAKLYRFGATLDGRSVNVAGIGAVFTPAAHRGRGHASDLIERLTAHAAADGAELAMLFSEIEPAFYERLGFTVVPITELTVRVVEDTRRGAPMTMVRVGDDRDLAAIAAMDTQRARPFRFHLDRGVEWLRFAMTRKRLLAGLGQAGARELQFFIAEEGTTAAAYVVIVSGSDAWTIECCGDRDPTGARIGALLQGLIAREPSAGRPAIRGWLPTTLRPPQLEVVDRAPSRDVMMLRALTPAGRAAPALADGDALWWRADAF
jgi:predicted N-acetyltransferase YhbS